MEDSRKQFQIYLPGLLKVLAESLYSSKKVALRELIQNAHDSCTRRRVEHRERGYQPRIEVFVDDEANTLIISDNGSGLTASEVTEYLSTIGRSYTRQLGEKLAILSPDDADSLIGQFGLGFLSAFLIASEVTLVTRSAQENSPTLQWRSSGDVHYNVNEIEQGPIGTTVMLEIKPSAAFILNEGVLTEAVRQYADFLQVPIYVSGSVAPVNRMAPPWDSLDPAAATLGYIEQVFAMPNPLAVIELHDHIIDLGHDSVTIPMRGFLFIPPSSVASINEYGDLTVYIRRMFICERQRDLLPAWARFVRGLIDCPYLQPTASREEIQQDDTFYSVQQALEAQLLAGLRRIASEEPRIWRQIVRGHADVLMGWAVQDPEFFGHIADIVTFRTSRGPLNLPEYLQQTDDKIYYVTRELGSLQEQLLGEGYGVPVLDASWFSVAPFLRRYAHQNPKIQLVQLDGDSNQLLQPVDEADYQVLLDFFRARGVRVRVVSFKPDDVPAIIMYPKDAEFIGETRSALDSGELPGPFAGMISDYLGNLGSDSSGLEGTLYLNVSSSLVQQLAKTENTAVREAALILIYHIARLFSGRMLDTQQIAAAFKETAEVIKTLVLR